MPLTQKEKNARQRLHRKLTGNLQTRIYEKTKKGFLVRLYRNMLSRTNGLVKPHLYKGLPILDKHVFYIWALENKDFKKLFKTWELCGYDRKLTPSINRIDSSKGYILGNIEFITHSENSTLGNYSRHYGGTVR